MTLSEIKYINNCRSKVCSALMDTDTILDKDKSKVEANLKSQLQSKLKNFNVVDTYTVVGDYGSIGAWFAIVEDDKYQYQVSKTFAENNLITVATVSNK